MSRATSFLALAVILVIVVVGGLFYLDQAVAPQAQTVEKVLPNDQFTRFADGTAASCRRVGAFRLGIGFRRRSLRSRGECAAGARWHAARPARAPVPCRTRFKRLRRRRSGCGAAEHRSAGLRRNDTLICCPRPSPFPSFAVLPRRDRAFRSVRPCPRLRSGAGWGRYRNRYSFRCRCFHGGALERAAGCRRAPSASPAPASPTARGARARSRDRRRRVRRGTHGG